MVVIGLGSTLGCPLREWTPIAHGASRTRLVNRDVTDSIETLEPLCENDM